MTHHYKCKSPPPRYFQFSKNVTPILCHETDKYDIISIMKYLITFYRCKAVITWLETNTLADKEEFDDKLKDLQKECSPIMTKLHQTGAKGPNVEEVD